MMCCWVKMEEELGFGDMRRRRFVKEEEDEWRKGPWSGDEDKLLNHYVQLHGEGRWNCVARLTGLKRNGKSCRLRWVNYLRPDLKRSQITPQEETIIVDLHARWGNRWSTIARSLPGRTDNEIKNYWRTHFKGKSTTIMPLPPPYTIRRRSSSQSHEKIKARRLLLLKKQQQLEDMKSMWLQQQQQQMVDDDDRRKTGQSEDEPSRFFPGGTTLPLPLPLPLPAAATPGPVDQLPTTYHDYSTLIPQFQFQYDDDAMIWDIGSLWNLQEIDNSYAATHTSSLQLPNSCLHPPNSSSFSF